MQINKNFVIAALVALMLISAIWGQNEAGKRKQLVRDKVALQTQVKESKDAVKISGELRAEMERQKDELKQAQSRLSNAQQKINELQEGSQSLAEKTAAQEEAVKALQSEKENLLKATEEMKKSSTAEAAKKQQAMQAQMESLSIQCAEEKTGLEKQFSQQKTALEQQLSQQKTALEEQEQKLTGAAQIIEQEQKQLKACKVQVTDMEKLQGELKDAEAANQQLEEERDKVLTDADTLRAQVIGLEKMVEERGAALEQTGNDLKNCRINNNVLISQISQKNYREKNKMKQKMLLPEQNQAPAQKQ